VIPTIGCVNINATTIMIGENAADLIMRPRPDSGPATS
jgi:choline dehydrogenase-like flavoprotein